MKDLKKEKEKAPVHTAEGQEEVCCEAPAGGLLSGTAQGRNPPLRETLQVPVHLKGQTPPGDQREVLWQWRSEWLMEPAQHPPLGPLIGDYCEGWGFFPAGLEAKDQRPWWHHLPVALILGGDRRGLSFFVQPESLVQVLGREQDGEGHSSPEPAEAPATV